MFGRRSAEWRNIRGPGMRLEVGVNVIIELKLETVLLSAYLGYEIYPLKPRMACRTEPRNLRTPVP